MKTILFNIAVFILFIQINFAQKCDLVLKNEAYISFISYDLQMPVQVNYILYKGGGDCNRKKFRFKNDTKIKLISDEYSKSGYDRGHLANAEDFAFNCKLDELTFRYYNCLPQTPNLNRGIWQTWEKQIRLESQQDSLLILCGGIWENSIKVNNFLVPKYCWKVVYSLKYKTVRHVLLFTNETKASCEEIKLSELEKKLGYKLFFEFENGK